MLDNEQAKIPSVENASPSSQRRRSSTSSSKGFVETNAESIQNAADSSSDTMSPKKSSEADLTIDESKDDIPAPGNPEDRLEDQVIYIALADIPMTVYSVHKKIYLRIQPHHYS